MALWHYLLLVSIFLLGAECRIITLNNGCDTTIWPAFLELFDNYTNPELQPLSNNELASHNFELRPRESINITTPEDWEGLIWGRDGCSFDSFGIGTCATGDCEGKLQCGGLDFPFTAFTAAYISMDPSGDDAYSIGLDNGFNLPMSISPYGHNNPSPCPASSCLSDINRVCPSDRQVRIGDEIVACESDCYAASNNVDPGDCCLDTDENCIKASNYSTIVKEACPTALIYGANTFRCTGANYMVSFCG